MSSVFQVSQLAKRVLANLPLIGVAEGCHTPPVEDQELIRRIYATTANNKSEDLSAWICRRCKKQQEERENGGTPASMGLDKEDYTLASSDPGRTSRSVTATSSRFATPRKPRNYDNRIVQDAPAQASAPSWRPPPAAPRKASPRSRPQAPRQVIVHSGSEAPSPEALNQSADDDDDNDDLYGPPVERRLIRVFPTLAEELREQAAARENVTMEASLVSNRTILVYAHEC
ncbi:hypothetical protein ID866_2330 [Astraeus odoratus]|nr:hypothetical protein ID866_2330 [Astraeus odoratus]